MFVFIAKLNVDFPDVGSCLLHRLVNHSILSNALLSFYSSSKCRFCSVVLGWKTKYPQGITIYWVPLGVYRQFSLKHACAQTQYKYYGLYFWYHAETACQNIGKYLWTGIENNDINRCLCGSLLRREKPGKGQQQKKKNRTETTNQSIYYKHKRNRKFEASHWCNKFTL